MRPEKKSRFRRWLIRVRVHARILYIRIYILAKRGFLWIYYKHQQREEQTFAACDHCSTKAWPETKSSASWCPFLRSLYIWKMFSSKPHMTIATAQHKYTEAEQLLLYCLALNCLVIYFSLYYIYYWTCIVYTYIILMFGCYLFLRQARVRAQVAGESARERSACFTHTHTLPRSRWDWLPKKIH